MDKVIEIMNCVLSSATLTEERYSKMKRDILEDTKGKNEEVQKLVTVALCAADRLREKNKQKALPEQ